MIEVIDRRRYDTDTATLLAHDEWADGRNEMPHGRLRKLYRTPKGTYFLVTLTIWQGETDSLAPLDLEEAEGLFEALPNHCRSYDEAFPDVVVEDA